MDRKLKGVLCILSTGSADKACFVKSDVVVSFSVIDQPLLPYFFINCSRIFLENAFFFVETNLHTENEFEF